MKITSENVETQKYHEYPALDGLITRPVKEKNSQKVIESTPDAKSQKVHSYLKIISQSMADKNPSLY